MNALRASTSLLLAAVVAMSAATPAAAEVVAGTPDESMQQAYGPMAPTASYSGAFDDTSYDDVDYLAFRVTQAGQTLEFTVANTTNPCEDPDQMGCPVYATLMGGSDQQVGGDGSAAGTVVTAGDVEQIEWTFAQPGTYYLLMESNGDEAPGSPSYTAGYVTLGGGSSGSTGSKPAPVLRSLTLRAHQHGIAVAAALLLGQPLVSLHAELRTPHGKLVRAQTLRSVSSGAHRLRLVLPAFWRKTLRRSHKLPLALRLTLLSHSGQRLSYTRRVTLTL